MKRYFCLALAVLLTFALCACGPASGGPGATAASSAAETTAPRIPDALLSEEEQIAMWKAVIEEMSKDDLTQEQALSKAVSGRELLEACGAELLALELPDRDSSWKVTPLHESWMVLYDTRNRRLTDFDSENCSRILDWDIAKEITVEKDRVRFFIGGRGFGSQTDYFNVYYIPSDDLSGCFGYLQGMEFTEQDGGWFAKGEGDDTFFYCELGEHLYFCSSHF